MGLDISVYKVIKPEKDPQKVEDFFVLSENSELNKFKRLSFERKNSYYDLETEIKRLGYDINNLLWNGEEYGKKIVFNYINKIHPLYECYDWVQTIWADTYFKSEEEFKNSQYFKEYEEKYKKVVKEHGWKIKWKFFASGNNEWYYNFVDLHNFLKRRITVSLVNPKTIEKKESCLAVEEVGYQRKGANNQFYEDGMWDSPCVTEKNVLLEHWEKYFSKQTPESPGGWGSGVEFNISDEEMRSRFKENIIDKFVENETFVIYH
jgi:hypothetical protein